MSVKAEVLKEKLAHGVPVRLGASGISMGQTFAAADHLEVEPVGGRIRFGDVLLWRHQGQWLAHRAIWKRNHRWLMKGDGNSHCDGWIAEEELAGRVTALSTRGVSEPVRRLWPGLIALVGLLTKK